ncbi:MAG: chemotaxis protein CheX [Phycisphaerae bacterium]
MHKYVINPPKQVLLDRVAIRAAEQASAALSKWFGRDVRIHTDGFATAPLSAASTMIGGGDTVVVAVHTGIDGALAGHVLLAFPEETAARLVNVLVGEGAAEAGRFDEMAQSAMCETGNLVSSAFVNGLATSLNVRAVPTPPTFNYDLGAALIEPLVADQVECCAEILYVAATFEISGDQLDWWLYVIPSPECMQVMAALLHQ